MSCPSVCPSVCSQESATHDTKGGSVHAILRVLDELLCQEPVRLKLRLREVTGELVIWHWQHDVEGHPKGGRLPGCYQVGTAAAPQRKSARPAWARALAWSAFRSPRISGATCSSSALVRPGASLGRCPVKPMIQTGVIRGEIRMRWTALPAQLRRGHFLHERF